MKRATQEANIGREYSIGELAKEAGTTPRTVRYYTLEGLLPAAGSRGRYACYSRDHLNRLRLIQRLKGAYLPLSAIREQLKRLDPDQVALLVEHNAHVLPDDGGEAARYIASLLETRKRGSGCEKTGRKKALWIRARERASEEDDARIVTRPHAGEAWTRFEVCNGIELHVRDGAAANVDDGMLARIRQTLQGGPTKDGDVELS